MAFIFIGMPASGKSTIGKKISQSLKLSWYDTDSYFNERYASPQEFFIKYGETKFREQERLVIFQALHRYQIISLGGGGILIDDVAELSPLNRILYLYTDYTVLYKRLFVRARGEFVVGLFKNFKQLYEERNRRYKMLSDYTVDTSKQSIQETTLAVVKYMAKNT